MTVELSRPPRFGPREPVKTKPQRFAVQSHAEGHEVVDFDGRPVAVEPDYGLAIETADNLNDAAFVGPSALALAISVLPATRIA